MSDSNDQDFLLADGSQPMQVDVLLQRLAQLGIAHTTTEHLPVFTVDEAKAVRGRLDGAHMKNLFLRNKKGRMWLLTCQKDRQLDLKALAERVGGNRFSFASAERLMKYLGVIPGAVTALAAVNDVDHKVTVLLDAALMNCDTLNLHPLVNTMTTSVSPADLLRFLESTARAPQIVEHDDILR